MNADDIKRAEEIVILIHNCNRESFDSKAYGVSYGIDRDRIAKAISEVREEEREAGRVRTLNSEAVQGLVDVLSGGYEQGSNGLVLDKNKVKAVKEKFQQFREGSEPNETSGAYCKEPDCHGNH